MKSGPRTLKASSALPLILVALAGATAGSPVLAGCTTAAGTTTCTSAAPNPWTSTVGTGRLDHNRTVNVLAGASIEVKNKNAISVGDNASITLKSGSLVRTDATGGSGLFGTGPQPVEFNSYGTLLVEEGAQLIERGTQPQAEAVNVHGVGNRIENRGLISGQSSAAIWFEDEVKTGPKNVVDNYGTIEQVNGGTVIGTSGGSGIDFYNQTGAVVKGSLAFANGNDRLFFFAGSTVTGNINGGGGANELTLSGASGTSDTLAGALANFQTLTKDGLGRWTITGTLTGFESTTVNQGTLALTGNNTNYSAGVLINAEGTLEARAQSLPDETNPADNIGNIRNNGILRFAQPDTGTYVGQIVGTGKVEKTGAGMVTLAPSVGAGNTYTGGTTIKEGTLAVAANSALGAASGGLAFDGGTLRTTAGFSMARAATLLAGGGTFETMTATLTESGVVSGVGKLTKTGAGTLALTGANTYAGGTQINAGTVEVSQNGNLGQASGTLGLDGGTLRSIASFTTSRATTLGTAGGTFETAGGTLTHSGDIGGAGALTKTGAGTLKLTSFNSYAGGTNINGGVVEISTSANLGMAGMPISLAGGTLRNTANVTMARPTTLNAGGGTFETLAGTTLSQSGAISGAGGLTKSGAGTMILTGAATHSGGTTISAGTLQLGNGGAGGSIAGNIVDNGALVFNRSNTLDVPGLISGIGSVTQAGTGVTRLAGNNFYFGATNVEKGALYVNGNQTGATGDTTAKAGTTLGGSGSIGGDVIIADGATLAPGDVGTAAGTLTINGTLGLSSGSLLAYSFGQANVPGGPLNDRTVVGGDLVLDGTLNVTTTPGGSFDPGVYRVFDYAGTLTDNGMEIGTIPAPDFYVQTSVANQVNLVNTTGLTLSFWDGDAGPKNNGAVNGGNGTWQNSAGNDNWTEITGTVNAPFSDGSFAVFTGAPGTVTVDDGLGAVSVAGIQFAVDGYVVEGDPITLAGAPDAIIRVGDGTGAGAGMTATIAADLTGASRLTKTDLGTLVLDGAKTYAGGTAINGGVLEIAEDASLGAAAGDVSFDGGTLRTTASFGIDRGTTLDAGGGTVETASGTTLAYGADIGGAGALTKTGAGTLVLDGTNSYAGGTAINGGTLVAAANASLGAAGGALSFDGGTLGATASFTMDRATTLDAGGGTIQTGAGVTLTQAGDIGGAGALSKTGAGTLVLTGDASATGGTTIAGGVLQLGNGGATGSLAGDVANNGVLAIDRSGDVALSGAISGTGILRQQGDGTTTLSGANSYAGGTEILGGVLAISADDNLGAASGTLTVDGGTLRNSAVVSTTRATTLGAGGGTFDTAAALNHAGVISGTGGLTKMGGGALVLGGANNYSGPTALDAGTLIVNGDQSAATGLTTAAAGTTLGGTGIIGGDVVVADGAHLSPGAPGPVPGTLTIAGDLGLSGGSLLDYSFGQANSVGGILNDLTRVGGDLTLDGTLNVTTTPGGAFEPGIYRVISYGGTLTDNGLAIGTIPSPGFFVQTSVASQVNLVNTAGLNLTFWDGDAGPKNNGVVNGGNGTWQASTGNDNWTEASGSVNAPWTDGGFAVFTGAPGTVTTDASLGAIRASGMQFAVDGYRVQGADIALVGAPQSIIRVGDGSTAGAAITATIAASLTGGTQLTKTDLGTLVLTGANSYSGGTAINGGTVSIASDAALGAASGALALDTGTLRTTATLSLGRATTVGAGGGTFETAAGTTLTQTSGVSGAGRLTKAGGGTMVMAGVGSYLGGTTIAGGTLQVGAGGTTGTIAGDVVNNGTLAFDRADAVTFAGGISGAGAVRQQGAGTTTLSGAASYRGATTVAAGTLRAGAAGAFSAASAHSVGARGTLDLADRSQTVAGLTNAGRVTLGGTSGTRLAISGNYVGQGGTLHFTTDLGGDGSATDRMTVAGNTSGSSVVEVTNGVGSGAPTVNGIKLIDVAGTSGGTFTLDGDTVIDGRPVVIGGAYAYSLWKGGASTPTDGDWYLRSQSTIQPGPPQIQPAVPTYEAYPFALLALNGLPTMQERVGNRYWKDAGNPPDLAAQIAEGDTQLPSGGLSEDRRAWARIEGSRSSLQPDSDTVDDAKYDLDIWKLQVGMDSPVREDDAGVLIAGLTFSYGQVSTDVSSSDGDGSIDTGGYGLGGSLTWLRDDDVYVDGQAQAMWYDSDLSSDDLGDLVSGNDGFGYALGVEVGKRIPWKPTWTVTPQAQVIYSSVDFDSFTDAYDVRVDGAKGETMPVRLGVALDQERAWKGEKTGDARRTHFYGIANVYYDLMADTGVTVGGTALTTDGDRTWGSLGVGGTYTWKDGAYGVYAEGLVSTSLSNFGDSYANTATAGFRIAW